MSQTSEIDTNGLHEQLHRFTLVGNDSNDDLLGATKESNKKYVKDFTVSNNVIDKMYNCKHYSLEEC